MPTKIFAILQYITLLSEAKIKSCQVWSSVIFFRLVTTLELTYIRTFRPKILMTSVPLHLLSQRVMLVRLWRSKVSWFFITFYLIKEIINAPYFRSWQSDVVNSIKDTFCFANFWVQIVVRTSNRKIKQTLWEYVFFDADCDAIVSIVFFVAVVFAARWNAPKSKFCVLLELFHHHGLPSHLVLSNLEVRVCIHDAWSLSEMLRDTLGSRKLKLLISLMIGVLKIQPLRRFFAKGSLLVLVLYACWSIDVFRRSRFFAKIKNTSWQTFSGGILTRRIDALWVGKQLIDLFRLTWKLLNLRSKWC